MVSRLLAFVLVLAMWPALGETVEFAVHLAEHGDLAHDPADEHAGAPLGADEHGCSALFHLCSSANLSATATPRVSVVRAVVVGRPMPLIAAPLDERGRDAPTPPIRPPIA